MTRPPDLPTRQWLAAVFHRDLPARLPDEYTHQPVTNRDALRELAKAVFKNQQKPATTTIPARRSLDTEKRDIAHRIFNSEEN